MPLSALNTRVLVYAPGNRLELCALTCTVVVACGAVVPFVRLVFNQFVETPPRSAKPPLLSVVGDELAIDQCNGCLPGLLTTRDKGFGLGLPSTATNESNAGVICSTGVPVTGSGSTVIITGILAVMPPLDVIVIVPL